MKEQNPSSSSSTTNIKLIIEKGPKEGESIEYKSNKLIKIGRVARGNTFQIKESASEEVVELRRNTRRQGRSKAIVEETSELGLDDKLGESVVEDGVGKRNLRGRGKKGVDTKNVVESASSKRILRSSKKAEKVTEVPELCKIPEETTDVVVAVEPKNTRGRKKKLLPVDVSEGTGLDEQKLAEAVPVAGRRTRRGRMAVAVEPLKNVESGGIEENVNDANETVRVDEGNEANNEPAQDQVIEKLVLTEEGRDGKESAAEGSSVKGSSKVADVDKVKKVAEELESRQDGAEGSMKKTEPDSRKWDLEKMTLGDFFDYIEEQRPKQIIDESEKIIADLEEKARQCYRIRQKAPHPPYKPVTRELVGCTDPICDDIRYPKDHVCEYTNEPCTYYLRYADGGSSLGVVINDPFTCGCHQKHPNPENRPYIDGILGLGSGKEGILGQLRELG
ncbi:FHA domain-containing protein-like protein [Tanacetum coccineum]